MLLRRLRTSVGPCAGRRVTLAPGPPPGPRQADNARLKRREACKAHSRCAMPPRRSRASSDVADASPLPRGRSPTRKRVTGTAVKSLSPAPPPNRSPASPPAPKPAPAPKKAPAKAAKAQPKGKPSASRGSKLQSSLAFLFLLAAMLEAGRRAGRSHVQSIMADFEPGQPLPVSKSTQKLHSNLFVVDLHCDATFVPRCVLQWLSPTPRTAHRSVRNSAPVRKYT